MSTGRRRSYPEKKQKTVGWQGIKADIPHDWYLGAVSSEQNGGYLRWDDDRMPRLEVKWSEGKGYVDLNSVISKYLQDLQKDQKKDDEPEISVDRDVQLLHKSEQSKLGWKCFRWEADAVGYGAAWTCKSCGRTTLAQVRIPADLDSDNAREFAASVLHGLSDHPQDDWVLWATHGLSCRVPEDFEMSDQKLMTGLVQFEFERDMEQIKVARWGMANVALKDKSLQQWVGEEMEKDLRRHDAQPEQTRIKGHDGLNVSGSSVGGAQVLKRLFHRYAGRSFADQFVARAWHCEQANNIYYVQTLVDRLNSDLADRIVDNIQCHEGSDDAEDQ